MPWDKRVEFVPSVVGFLLFFCLIGKRICRGGNSNVKDMKLKTHPLKRQTNKQIREKKCGPDEATENFDGGEHMLQESQHPS